MPKTSHLDPLKSRAPVVPLEKLVGFAAQAIRRLGYEVPDHIPDRAVMITTDDAGSRFEWPEVQAEARSA
jgi:hypothetical protein